MKPKEELFLREVLSGCKSGSDVIALGRKVVAMTKQKIILEEEEMAKKTLTSDSENIVVPSLTKEQQNLIDRFKEVSLPPVPQELYKELENILPKKEPNWPLVTMPEGIIKTYSDYHIDKINKDLMAAKEEIESLKKERDSMKDSLSYLREAVEVLTKGIDELKNKSKE